MCVYLYAYIHTYIHTYIQAVIYKQRQRTLLLDRAARLDRSSLGYQALEEVTSNPAPSLNIKKNKPQ